MHTDGWTGYDDLEALGYVHKPLVIDGDPGLKIEAQPPCPRRSLAILRTDFVAWPTTRRCRNRDFPAYLNEFRVT